MSKVIDQLSIGKYVVLKLDSMPLKEYSKFRINGIIFDPVPIYEAQNCIAFVSENSFLNQTVEFI